MVKTSKKIKDKVGVLEDAKAQVTKGYLELERERTLLRSAIENFHLGFMMIDDYKKVIFKNIAIDEILGPIDHGGWTVEKLRDLLHGKYDLTGEIDKCFRGRTRIGPTDINFDGKKIRIFISPINIFKKSLSVPSVVILLEDIS